MFLQYPHSNDWHFKSSVDAQYSKEKVIQDGRGSCSLYYQGFSKRSCRNSWYQTLYFLNDNPFKCIYIYIAFSCLNVLLLYPAKIKAVSLCPVGKKGINSYAIHFTYNNANIYIIFKINWFDNICTWTSVIFLRHAWIFQLLHCCNLYTYQKLVWLILPLCSSLSYTRYHHLSFPCCFFLVISMFCCRTYFTAVKIPLLCSKSVFLTISLNQPIFSFLKTICIITQWSAYF